MQVKFVNHRWEFQGQVLTSNLPQCSETENFKNGYEFALLFLPMVVMLVCIKFVSRLFTIGH